MAIYHTQQQTATLVPITQKEGENMGITAIVERRIYIEYGYIQHIIIYSFSTLW